MKRIPHILFEKGYFLAPLLIIFLFLKYHDLSLPYYWDEAWSYIPAIKEMAKQSPSLLPGNIAPELYRGHPLLFYFITSTWIKLFGNTILIARLLPLLTSVLLIIFFFKFIKERFNNTTAILSTIFLMTQSLFLAQSSFLLPEVMMSLFAILAFKAYFNNNKIFTTVWLTLTLFTKESGAIIWFVILLAEAYNVYIKQYKIKPVNLVKSHYYLFIPIILICSFFILQKITTGWFFFPKHIDYININEFSNKLHGYSSYLFIFMGRNLLSFAGIISLFYLIIKKDHKIKDDKEVIIFSVFIVTYLLFSSINFYSPRYLIAILPFTIAIFIYFIYSAFSNKKYLFFPLIVIIFINNAYFTIHKKGATDHTLGYRNMIRVHQKVVQFCEDKGFYKKNIATHFLMKQNLSNEDLGYLTQHKPFQKVTTHISQDTDIIIISNIEQNQSFQNKILTHKTELIKKYKMGACWSKIYRMNKNH